ncbi:hypothetical protein [Lysobacter sp. FW306-1B-D06B]|uniref:hypothetical protein n=1 Tax=Lysobacter sp. FW306-1B-D06B TaxID=3140250 RepID=UPI0031405ADA
MNRPITAAAYADRYAPAKDLRLQLPEVGDQLMEQLYALSATPSVEACDQASTDLAGAQTAVRKLREALIGEGAASGR